jgi:hypothetical protein
MNCMTKLLHDISDWSEVWGLLIPAFFIFRNKRLPDYLKPVRVYVFSAFVINLLAILIQKYKIVWGFHEHDLLWSNNFLYNSHSIVRFFLFSLFFYQLKQPFMQGIKRIIPVLFLLFIIINFSFYETYFDNMLSSRLLATESALLLFYSLQYFIFLLLEDRVSPSKKQAAFWVVTGLSIYVATSFFIFLFYTYLIKNDLQFFAVDIWDVHNIAYLILCICIAKAFYSTYE